MFLLNILLILAQHFARESQSFSYSFDPYIIVPGSLSKMTEVAAVSGKFAYYPLFEQRR